MSTYWGYACISHNPPLISEHWFNNGEQVLAETFVAIRRRLNEDAGSPLVMGPSGISVANIEEHIVEHRGYKTASPTYWLLQHPECEVVLHNEYGGTKEIGDALS